MYAETVLLTLANPEVVQQAREARLDLKAAEAEHQALLARLQDGQLSQQATIAQCVVGHAKMTGREEVFAITVIFKSARLAHQSTPGIPRRHRH